MGYALALGTFDGLHKGHQKVLSSVLPYNSVAVTFRIPPKSVTTGTYNLLMTPKEKIESLKSFGIKHIELLDFEKVCNLEAIDFLELLREKFNPEIICCGYNFRFGKNAVGDVKLLDKFCRNNSIEFICCDAVCNDGDALNSTAIRKLLSDGKIDIANPLLYDGFKFRAPVIHGDNRGSKIGFPTINQKYPDVLVKLKNGVYASKVIIDGNEYYGVSNIGIRPTWKTESIMSETYILNFSQDIYDKCVTVKPLKYLREEKLFNSLDELNEALTHDVECLISYLADNNIKVNNYHD